MMMSGHTSLDLQDAQTSLDELLLDIESDTSRLSPASASLCCSDGWDPDLIIQGLGGDDHDYDTCADDSPPFLAPSYTSIGLPNQVSTGSGVMSIAACKASEDLNQLKTNKKKRNYYANKARKDRRIELGRLREEAQALKVTLQQLQIVPNKRNKYLRCHNAQTPAFEVEPCYSCRVERYQRSPT
ncbi:unnamed protein product [Phytophthora lilii]|uniref:Unnamed protein product n=1 Tax=Phytophthora lilii TaxID=2077276 RepID=A0A9W6TLN3_9STRA|nr:unnamed protein product [Phytophthora lilii]